MRVGQLDDQCPLRGADPTGPDVGHRRLDRGGARGQRRDDARGNHHGPSKHTEAKNTHMTNPLD